MPTYDYVCDACGRKWEKVQSIKADPIPTCPHCGQASARRLIGAGAGLIFKGSGFYITDYRDKGYADQAKAESGGGGDAKGESKGDAKGESKGDAKAGDKPAGTGGDTTAKPAESKPAASTPTPAPAPAAKPDA